jgi:hypothetical protein
MKSIEKDNLASIKQQLLNLASKSRIGGNTSDENTGRIDESPLVYPYAESGQATNHASQAKPSVPSSYQNMQNMRNSPVKMTLIEPDKENN